MSANKDKIFNNSNQTENELKVIPVKALVEDLLKFKSANLLTKYVLTSMAEHALPYQYIFIKIKANSFNFK